jgi:alpha-D-xyloside xylohydrolase
MGPELQYTAEKPADPISLYVHLGADGDFGLYEDDGLTNAWQKGEFSLINLHWNDQSKVLTIGKRQGSFASMLPAREFDVFFVSEKAHSNFRDLPPKVVRYAGEAIDVRLSQ